MAAGRKREHSRSAAAVQGLTGPCMVAEEREAVEEGSDKSMSAFEKMMSTFDAYKDTVVMGNPLQPLHGALHSSSNGVGGGVRVFGGERGGSRWAVFGGEQDKMWQEFVSGAPQQTMHTTAVSHNRAHSTIYTQFIIIPLAQNRYHIL